MLEIMNRLGDLKATFCYKRKLEEIQKKASVNPENLLYQVRIGDFLVKLKKRPEAVNVYEQTAQKFIQKNLFVHAIALRRIIFRLQPSGDNSEQKLVLARLYDQMLEHREETLETKGETAQEDSP